MNDDLKPGTENAAITTEETTTASVLTPQEQADQAEDDEWAKVLADEYGDRAPQLTTTTTTQKEGEENGAEQPGETTTTTTTVAPDSETTTSTTTIADAGDTTTTTTTVANEETEEPDTSGREARAAQREYGKQLETYKNDVREQLYKDAPTELRDKDGDPIKTIEDVMKYNDPSTGEAFTEERAAMWLLSAQQQFNQSLAEREKTIEKIADLNIDLKDQADSITERYGALLKDQPELRDKLWAQFEKTLVKDKETDVITGAPLSMEEFYDTALAPYVDLAQKLESDKTAQEQADQAERDRKEKERLDKEQRRADRSDVFGSGGSVDTRSDEDKEWDAAIQAEYGDRLPKK